MNQDTAPADPNIETVRRLNERSLAGDVDGAYAEFHPTVQLVQPESLPHGGVHHGHDGVRRAGELAAAHWERRVEDITRIGCGDHVLLVERQTWTARDTGRSVTLPMIELFSFTDGKISRIEVYVDTHVVLETLKPVP